MSFWVGVLRMIRSDVEVMVGQYWGSVAFKITVREIKWNNYRFGILITSYKS